MNDKSTIRTIDEPTLLKQYELIIGVFQNEGGRFWTRFNIFTAIELGGLAAVLSNLAVLASNPCIFRYVLVFLFLLSLAITLISCRGVMSARLIFRLLKHIESTSKSLVSITDFVRKNDRLPQYVNYLIAICVCVLFSASWLIALVYFEVTDYVIY